MNDEQNTPNPDVNSYPNYDSGGSESTEQNPRNESDDIERTRDENVIPVPPDSEPTYPVEEPPRENDAPKKL